MIHHHFYYFADHGARNSSSGFWGAFWGAFLAFIFGLITYVITKRRERFVQHKNALVKIERALNKHLDDLEALQTIAKDIERVIDQKSVPTNRLFGLSLPDGIDMEIVSLDLINKFFTYRSSLDLLKINVDSTNHAMTRLEDLFINGQVVKQENFLFIKKMMQGFTADIPNLIERATKFLVLIRINIKKTKNKNTFIYGVFNASWDQKISSEEIKEENEKLLKETKEIKEKITSNF